MKNLFLLFIALFITNNISAQRTYQTMMDDLSINFYDVCAEAELYFETHDKNVKGSGWKPYQRWKHANEYKYYPSGDRSNVDPFFVSKAYEGFLNNSTKSLYPNGWNELGPYRIDSISGHYAAGLGRVEDFYVDPNNSNRIYLGSRSGGFWKTTDGGTNWQGGSSDFLFASGVNTIAVSPTNPDSVLINVRNSRNGNSHGIYRSVDGGNTFTQSNFNPVTTGEGGLGTDFKIYIIAYHPTVPNLVFVGTSKGIFRSEDNLTSWTQLQPSGDIIRIEFHPTNANIMYIYDDYVFGPNEDLVLRSTDMGLSYSQSNQITGNNDRTGYLSVSTDCPDCLYFASDNGIWKSTDLGMNFSFISNSSESCDGFAVNDTDTSQLIYGYVDVDRSSDGGKTYEDATRWSLGNTNGAGNGHQVSFQTSTNYVHADLRVAKCINGVFYVGTDGLLAKSSDNGLNWTVLSQGTSIRENYKLGASQSNTFRSVSGSQDNGTSIKLKDYWLEFYGADGMEGIIHPLNDDWIISSLQYGGRRRTKDGGRSQEGVSPSGQSGSGNAAWEAPITYDPNNQMRVYNFSDSIFVSETFGRNWNYVGKPSSFSGTIRQAAIAENNSDIIIVSQGSAIDKSIDGGLNFNSIKGSLPSNDIQDIAFDPNDDNLIVVVYARYQNDNNKVFKTTNGGLNWVNITHNLNNMPIHSVVIDHTDASNIYLGAEIGVYTMPLSASSWTLYNPSLPNTTIEELEIVNGSNTLKAATWGRGLWEFSLVGRNDFPAIMTTRISDMPTDNAPKVSRDQFVTSTISYDNTLSSVYVEWSANTPTFGNAITMSNTQDSTWVSDTPLPDLAIGTKIYFKVFTVGNNNDTSETYKFMYTLFPYEYCTSFGSTNWDGNVTLVDFNTINNPTGKTQPYTDYSATHNTEVFVNDNYDLTVNLNTDNGNYEYFSRVWIDWNNDADFEDENETYELGSTTDNSDGPTSLSPFNIVVPAGATIGDTKMRVSCRFDNYPNECDEDFDGEVEDYLLTISENPLTYVIDDKTICSGSYVHFNYTGIALDNIQWTFSKGIQTFTSSNFTDSLLITGSGNFNLEITGTISGQTINNSVSNAIEVQAKNNPFITTNGNILTANPANKTYQWINCNSNFSKINGEINVDFMSASNGSFAVMVSDQYCEETSECKQITGIGIIENTFENDIKLYPNPTDGKLAIVFSDNNELVSTVVKNNISQEVLNKTFTDTDFIEIDIENQVKGIYFLYIESKGQKAIFKILKE